MEPKKILMVLLPLSLVAIWGVSKFSLPLPVLTDSTSSSMSAPSNLTSDLTIEPKPTLASKSDTATSPQISALEKLQTLGEIFESKNDNDPRLDTTLRFLNELDKVTFEKEYQKLEPEKRNERGTIVFLVGRNINTKDDFKFLTQVIEEPSCKSLSNCAVAENGDSSSHDESANEITRHYPQIVAIKSIERYLEAHPDSNEGLEVLKRAAASKNPVIKGMASVALRKLAQRLEQKS